ncbi:MAG: peptidoglycan-binding domain-containing protein [bacterium]|nr:peptidoglycan-binding domain-containing protein [bacterium]MDZ4285081.1 peptidoglycan-binding domain-containing protein [Patescibacteria group bacterium]
MFFRKPSICQYAVLCGAFFALFFLSNSAEAVNQKVHITITPDFKASGHWTFPLDTKYVSASAFDNVDNFGATGAMTYLFRGAADEMGNLETGFESGYIIVPNRYKTNSGVHNLYIDYDISTVLTQPVAVYEFWVARGSYFLSPAITIDYPADWKVLSAWPSYEAQGQTLSVAYPAGNSSYVAPVLVAFATPNAGTGNAVKTVGRYTVAGSVASVAKLETALSQMSFVDDLFVKSLGIKPPENILIYAADLSDIDVGYEATALAAPPNVVLYNKDYLDTETLSEIKTTLVHEMAHLVERNQRLFYGAAYSAKWFKEGIAVFMETQARPYIFADIQEQTLLDITNRTHLFSAKELKAKYDKNFDYSFEGGIDFPIRDSYTHSGVIISNLYKKVGADGMVELLRILKTRNPSPQGSTAEDTDMIVSAMTQVSGLERADLFFPYKGSPAFDDDVKSLVRADYSDAAIAALAEYMKTGIPSYFNSAGGAVLPPQPELEQSPIPAAVAPPSPSSTSVPVPVLPLATTATATIDCKLTRTLGLGMRDAGTGGEVSKLQKFLIKKGQLEAGLATGYFGKLTQAAVRMWQGASGVVSSGSPATTGYGLIGPKSRALLVSQCGT